MIKKDCFALKKDPIEYCSVLTKFVCMYEDCKFYKPKARIEIETMDSAARRRRMGFPLTKEEERMLKRNK